MLPQPSVDALPTAIIQPGSVLLSRSVYHSRLPLRRLGASKRSDPTNFRKAKMPSAAPARLSVRCTAEMTKSVTTLTEKLKSLTGLEETVTVKATVRILEEGFCGVGSHALSALQGKKVKMFLVSLDVDPETKDPKLSAESDLIFVGGREGFGEEKGDTFLSVLFSVPKDFGRLGAILIESQHPNEFFLKSINVEMPDAAKAYFPCNSWITESKHNFGRPRVFFASQAYLPKDTPPALIRYRQEDLIDLRGDGTGKRISGERIYDYDVYNDLGNADKKKELKRPVLGGSAELPYPRRCRTGRNRSKTVPDAEVTVIFDGNYLPRDERFSAKKLEMFLAASVRCFGHEVLPALEGLLNENRSFDRLEDIEDLYVGELRAEATNLTKLINPSDGTPVEFPSPGVVQANKEGWRSDEEFGRQRLAGVNPMVIERLKVFPPVSSLDPETYGSATSSITEEHLKPYLGGLTVEEAMQQKRLYILDYHDALMPYVNKINELDGKMYASRTICFLKEVGVLVPIAIELSLPPKNKGDKAVIRVVTPQPPGLPDWIWRLAKAHVLTADSGIHELVSHWLRTHACVEPFILATHRQLSSMHPVNVLLFPHFKDTMNINAMARTSLINGGGIIEQIFTPGKYCAEISSVMYKTWQFDEQSLPKDLLKRGMAEEDASAKHGLKLSIEDYPFAADGLDLWAAIKQWVTEYLAIYYTDDEAVRQDTELQSWWSEVKNKGHEDHAGAAWWAEMKSVAELEEVLTTLIWLTSGHHASVNFGQYAYFGYVPNSPTLCRKLIPEDGTAEYTEMMADPEKFFLHTIPSHGQTVLAMAIAEVLAQHMGDEEYLGERNDSQWSADSRAVAALDKFRNNLKEVEAKIDARNATRELLHRSGPALLPYTLFVPQSTPRQGLTFHGVPNSISI